MGLDRVLIQIPTFNFFAPPLILSVQLKAQLVVIANDVDPIEVGSEKSFLIA